MIDLILKIKKNMKKKFTSIFLLILSSSILFSANIQKTGFENLFKNEIFKDSCDIITLQNGDEISAKVIEISDNQIKYKKCSNLQGPVYSIEKSEVLFIKYKNGQKDVFTTNQNTKNTKKKGELSYTGFFIQTFFKGNNMISRRNFKNELKKNNKSREHLNISNVLNIISYILGTIGIINFLFFTMLGGLLILVITLIFLLLANSQFNKAIEEYNNDL